MRLKHEIKIKKSMKDEIERQLRTCEAPLRDYFLTKYEKQNPKIPFHEEKAKLKMARELYREFVRGEAERRREINHRENDVKNL